ncbi:MAG TPA: hypothetical protein DF715_03860 [Oceanicaulis sp.]|uniref:Uncharacterized protein n=1 Tax=Glycocaulis albus TaxID=1382801 RepID=A0ABQ1XC58_9PROT|nr:hypothetical protein [Glycocaulis albus]MBV5256916.1 hypothetical protein [Synechococcus moorigangaii CMS01]GGG89950.1 hypothetical protein GCM10007420_01210 [Glycocaulis albus]HCY54675.1 hypothetical protein [Oceanicaulis sp.]
MIIAIVLGTMIGVAAAFSLRQRLATLAFLTWIGWLLVGTGIPVLAGQLGFLWLAQAPGDTPALAVPLLASGLGAGLAWAACVAGLRLTYRQSR